MSEHTLLIPYSAEFNFVAGPWFVSYRAVVTVHFNGTQLDWRFYREREHFGSIVLNCPKGETFDIAAISAEMALLKLQDVFKELSPGYTWDNKGTSG